LQILHQFLLLRKLSGLGIYSPCLSPLTKLKEVRIKNMDLRKYNNGMPLQLSLIDETKEVDEVKDRVFLTTEELAIRWRKSIKTIYNQRGRKQGAPFYKINGSVLYDLNDIIKYELDNFFNGKGAVNG
jgi:hypothetical protein